MRIKTSSLSLIFLATLLLSDMAEAAAGVPAESSPFPTPPTITNTASFFELSPQEANRAYPLHLEGIVTLVDLHRNLLVLQDATGAVAAEFSLTNVSVRAGDRVVLTGKDAIPQSTAFSEFPAHADEREVRNSFEINTNARAYTLVRLRGFLHPPADGLYTFWIASKGASELWLSTNADPGQATRIANVPMGKSTLPRQWQKYPSQTSKPVSLRANIPYYIEALREQRGGRDPNLAVAWRGPGLQQSIIAGEYLVPWVDWFASPDAKTGDRTNGLLQETWNNFFANTVEPLTTRSPVASPVTVFAPRLDVQEHNVFPEPLPIQPGGMLTSENQYRWVELQGTVAFMGREGTALVLELAEGLARTRVRVLDWPQTDWPRLENARVRVRGVAEPSLDAAGNVVVGTVWSPSAADVVKLKDTSEDWSRLKLTAISLLSPINPDLAWGRRIRVRGTVTRRDNGSWVIKGPDSFWAYLARDGTNWQQVASPLEIEMGADAQMGLVATAFGQKTLTTGRFDQVNGLNGVGKQSSVPDSKPGHASLAGSVYTIEGGGLGIGSAFDEFHFAHQPLGEATEIKARILSVTEGDSRACAGIMIRDTLEGSARCVALTLTSGNRALLLARRKENTRGEFIEIPNYAAPCWLKLTRRSFDLVAEPAADATAPAGQEVDVTGLLAWEDGRPVLREARCLEPKSAKPEPRSAATADAAPDKGYRIERIADLLPQNGAELKDGTGVTHVRGVVTFCNSFGRVNYLAIQDDSASAFVRLSGRFNSRPLQAGQLVELELKSANGKWPVPFDPGSINVIAWTSLPEPVLHPAEYTLPLRGESRWVELEGMVRSVAGDGTLMVMGKDGTLPVWVGGLEKDSVERYVDSLVRVHGVLLRAGSTSPMLLVPSSGFVQVSEPPPSDPFVLPVIPVVGLKQMNFIAAQAHRLKIAGVVTYKKDNLLFVQDHSGGVPVQTLKPSPVNVGDPVDAVGFPDFSGGILRLTEALTRYGGADTKLKAMTCTIEQLLEGDGDGMLIRVKATLLERRIRGPQQILELQSGQRIFQAVLDNADGKLPAIPLGSVVELTGVSWTERLGGAASPDGGKPIVSSFQLLLSKPADVVLLQRPPWWTWKHTVAVVGALMLVLVAATIWIHQLRRRVIERTQALRAAMTQLEKETKTSATLTERNRLAAEIHDGLEQGLNGIMMQLAVVETRLMSSPEAAKHHLDLARKMVRFSRMEVRHSLWDWKSPALANHDLKTALADIVSQMADGNLARVNVKVTEVSHPLPPAMEHHLLRICQEALTNALKHAQARTITVSLDFTDDAVELSVLDDGRGFEPDTVLNGMVGHLGLQNLRSRARQLGGELTVTSAPGKGATIAVKIPFQPESEKLN